MSELVPLLLDMIEEGDVELAVARRQELTAVEPASFDDGVRLARLTELLAVARKLPLPVARALAAGIRDGNLASIKPRLEVYAQTNYGRALKARRVLFRHAPNLAAAVRTWLLAPAPDAYRPPVDSRRSAGSAAGLISAMVMMAVAGSRCAVSSSHHELSSPRFDLQPIKLMNEVKLDPLLFDLTRPTPFHSDRSKGLQLAEVQLSVSAIMRTGSTVQVEAAQAVSLATARGDCDELREAVKHLDYASSPMVSKFQPAIADHVLAIHERLDAVCRRHPAR